MTKLIFVCFAVLLTTGYVFDFAFHQMNKSSDTAYIGGATIAILWVVVLLGITEKLAPKFKEEYKRRMAKYVSKRVNNTPSSSGNTVSSDNLSSNVKLHSTDRPGDGGNRG